MHWDAYNYWNNKKCKGTCPGMWDYYFKIASHPQSFCRCPLHVAMHLQLFNFKAHKSIMHNTLADV